MANIATCVLSLSAEQTMTHDHNFHYFLFISAGTNMVLAKDETQVQSNPVNGCKPRLFDSSTLYRIITSSPVDQVASLTKKAIFSDDEDVRCRCPLSGDSAIFSLDSIRSQSLPHPDFVLYF